MTDQPKRPQNDFDIPFDEEIEKMLLGSVFINPSVFLSISAFLQPDDFYLLRHRYIWQAMLNVAERGEPLEYQTLRVELEASDLFSAIGGDLYMAEIINSTPTAMYAEQYGHIIERDAVRRRLMQASADIQTIARDRQLSLDEVISQAETRLFAISERRTLRDIVSMREATLSYFERIETMLQDKSQTMGLPSGFGKLDTLLGGLQRSDLMIFAGRPGMGKTSFMLSLALNAAATYKARILIFTLEMGVEQMIQRLVSMETGINMQKLRTGQFNQNEHARLMESLDRLATQPIFIDDSPSLTPIQMRTKCQRIKHEYGLDLVILDYLQLMHAPGYNNNRVQEISYISRQMKELARELNVPLLSAAQLSRAVEQRADKRPQLSDLRESGCLTGESLVWLPDEGRYEAIENLVGKSGFRVLSLNQTTYQLESAEVSHAFSTGTRPVYRLETALGRKIRATGNHQFLTIEGWKRLDELTTNDHIALPRHLEAIGKQTMNDAELALLGHLIGDGCTLPNHAVQYTTVEIDLAETVAQLANDVFGNEISPRIHKEPGRNWYQVFLSSTRQHTHGVFSPVRTWMEGLGIWGLRSYEKYIPSEVFAQQTDMIALFLRHLWATDGCITSKKSTKGQYPVIYYASSSKRLSYDVQSLLLRLGINARIKRLAQKNKAGTVKGRDQYHVGITGIPDLERFIYTIGAVGSQKTAGVDWIANYINTHQSNTNRGVVPNQAWQLYALPAMKREGMTHRQLQSGIGISYCGNGLYKQNMSRVRAATVAGVVKSEELTQLATSDVYWDKIKTISPDGDAEVFDLTVPTHSNFIADNIIVHNSIEQDSDIVMFLYRDVVYNEATENPNQADVIVAKHRNGPTDTIPLYFDASSTRFLDGAHRPVDLTTM